mmetsp:Transcript_33510/g.61581  ORF Transcript_33510/g.61581 Transcript_33510/m.61581 type:complete len:296 (+) Transcript_33510:2187-3074(+)
METDTQRLGENALPKRNERSFLQGHVVCQGADTSSEDVLAQAEDGGRHGAIPLGEFLQGIAHLERFLKVTLLVHVNGLYKLSTGKNHGVILILRLALSQDGVARQTNTVQLLDLAIAVALHKARVEGHLSRTLVTHGIDVGHAHVREAVHEGVNVVGLGVLILFHLAVDLARHDVAKLFAHEVIGRVVVKAFEVGEQAQGLLEVHHPTDSPVQCLGTNTGPLPCLVGILLGPDLLLVLQPHTFQKVGPVGLEQGLQVEHGGNSKGIAPRLELALVEGDSLLVVGSQNVPREHVVD